MRGKLIVDQYGSLRIWAPPVKGKRYMIGVDTSSGVRGSDKENDPAAACAIEMESCEQVAEWSGYYLPHLWGMRVARLGWYYNEAGLAIETHPSPHGITVYDTAARYGYTNLSCQVKVELRDGKANEKKGWTRPANSSQAFYDRGREALADGVIVRSEALLDELAGVRVVEGKLDTKSRNDRIIGWCLSLLARDQAYNRGEVKKEVKPIEDLADLDWRREAEEARVGAFQKGEPYDLFDGV